MKNHVFVLVDINKGPISVHYSQSSAAMALFRLYKTKYFHRYAGLIYHYSLATNKTQKEIEEELDTSWMDYNCVYIETVPFYR